MADLRAAVVEALQAGGDALGAEDSESDEDDNPRG